MSPLAFGSYLVFIEDQYYTEFGIHLPIGADDSSLPVACVFSALQISSRNEDLATYYTAYGRNAPKVVRFHATSKRKIFVPKTGKMTERKNRHLSLDGGIKVWYSKSVVSALV